MKKLYFLPKFVITGLLWLSLLSSCVVVNGTRQRVNIQADPIGTEVYVDGEYAGDTPLMVNLKRKEDHNILLKKDGYVDGNYILKSMNSYKGTYFAKGLMFAVGGIIVGAGDEHIDPLGNGAVIKTTPVGIGLMGAAVAWTLLDAGTGTQKRFQTNKVNYFMQEKPKEMKTDSCEAMACFPVRSKILKGSSVAWVKSFDEREVSLGWKNDFDSHSPFLESKANEELKNLGFNVIALDSLVDGDKREISFREEGVRAFLMADLVKLKILFSQLTRTSKLYEIDCMATVNWKVVTEGSDKVLFEKKVEARSLSYEWLKDLKKNDDDTFSARDETILSQAFKFSLYKVLRENPEIYDLFKVKDPMVLLPEEAVILDQSLPVANSLPELVDASVTVLVEDGHGSGFVISHDGYVVTNYHVVQEATNREVEVVTNAQQTLKAKIVGFDQEQDVALLKVEGTDFIPIGLQVNGTTELGGEVISIGTPANVSLGQTISKGILSGKRNIDGKNYIQTDVSISPGNSGGPLIQHGKVIGVINAKVVGRGIEGIGFAIPIPDVLEKLNITITPGGSN